MSKQGTETEPEPADKVFGWPIWKHQTEESNIPTKSVLLSQGVNQELSILKETLPCVQHLVLN